MSKQTRENKPDFGALVFSIDFELHWGVRDLQSVDGSYRDHLFGERKAVPALLDLFRTYEIAGTWATVGFLFAATRDELEQYTPALKPEYDDPTLSPYQEKLGADESADPLHYAASLIRLIQQTPQQEIGTHTYSHYYCLEAGQNAAMFRADLTSAIAIAKQYDIELTSIVFPRNQVNPAYFPLLQEHGITSYRGNENNWMYRCHEQPGARHPLPARLGRLADSYVNLTGKHLTDWAQVKDENGFCNVPASRFLRPRLNRLPSLESLRLARVRHAMRTAAQEKKIIHLWTHAHNHGVSMQENLAFIRAIGEEYKMLRNQYGMKSMTMTEVAQFARGEM